MSEGGDIFSKTDPRDIYREAELLTLRQMASTLKTMQDELILHRKDLADTRQDIAVIKERQHMWMDMRDDFSKVKAKVDVLQARNDKQDGAYSFVTVLKEFGPWIFGLLVLAWSVFEKKP